MNNQQVEKEVKAAMRKCRTFAKREYNLSKECKLELDHKKIARSWGCSTRIKIRPRFYLLQDADGMYNFREYAAIDNQPAIGGFRAKDPRLVIRALVAHEYAHFIQTNLYHKGNKRMRKAHGEGWRDVYADLRWLLVNRELRQEQQQEAA